VAALVYIILGLVGLIGGSGIAVSGARALARALRLSPLVIGLTFAAIGTSLPEIATNVGVAVNTLNGFPAADIAVGNIVGSCLSQITLLLGVTAMFSPQTIERTLLRRDGGMVCLALAAMFLVCLDGTAQRWEGVALIVVYVAYLAYVWRSEPRQPESEVEEKTTPWLNALQTAIGIGVVVISADLIVEGGVTLARASGANELTIGLAVGVATGLPELALSLRAVRDNAAGLAVGNLLGSNITDPLLSFGLGAVVAPVNVVPEVLWLDFPTWAVMTGLGLALLGVGAGLGRIRGGILIGCFLVYLVFRITGLLQFG
jgi:cation:H+ antiporter